MNDARTHTSPWLNARRGLMRHTARMLYLLLGRIHVAGLENIPRGTAYVAALNHTSFFDPPLVLAFWPESMAAIGAADYFGRPVQGKILSLYGILPVRRGSYDRNAIDEMLKTLRAGTPLLIAPEGGRSHQPAMRRARPGIALVVEETGVPVIPVGVSGATDGFLKRGLRLQRPHIEMHVGEPFHLPRVEGGGKARRESRQHNADLVMRRIAQLLPDEYHGAYAGTNDSGSVATPA